MTELGAIDEFDERDASRPQMQRSNTTRFNITTVTPWMKIDTLHHKNLLERKMDGFCDYTRPKECCLGVLCLGTCSLGTYCAECIPQTKQWRARNKGKWMTIVMSCMGAVVIALLTHLVVSGETLAEQMFMNVSDMSYNPESEFWYGRVVLSGWDFDDEDSSVENNEYMLSDTQKMYRKIFDKIGYGFLIIGDSEWKRNEIWYEISNTTNPVVEFGAYSLTPMPMIQVLYMGLGNNNNFQIMTELQIVKSVVANPEYWMRADFGGYVDRNKRIMEIANHALPFEVDYLPFNWTEYKRWALSFWLAAMTGMFMGYFMLRNMIDTVKYIMVERQSGTKDLMAFLGLNQYQYWIAQFYTHSSIYGLSVFVNACVYMSLMTEANRLHDFDIGADIYIYILFLFFISFANITLFGFACSSFLQSETFFDAWSLGAGILSIFLPQIFMVMLENGDNAGQRFMVQFIPIFNFFFGLRDCIYGIKADTVIFHFVDLFLWTYLTLYFDLTIPTVKGAQSKKCCYCLKSSQKTEELTTQMESFDIPEEGTFLHVSKLKKNYGNFTAVNELDLDLPKGKLFGLLGFNGAGKSTTINMITGLVQPSSGKVMIAGHDVSTEIDSLRKMMGVCPQTNIMWDDLTVLGHLQLFGRLRGFTDEEIEKQGDDLLEALEMTRVKNTLAGELSGGQKRKLMVMQAFMGDPPFILLDEPTAGVDVDSRDCIQQLIKDRQEGKLIILTTHHMSEADYLCEEIAIMSEGQISIQDTPGNLKAKEGSGTTLELDAGDKTEELQSKLKQKFDGDRITVETLPTGYTGVLCKNPADVPGVVRIMEGYVKDGGITIEPNSLESVFLNLANKQAAEANRHSTTDLTPNHEKLQKILQTTYVRPNFFMQFLHMNWKRALLTFKDPSPIFQGVAVVLLFAILALFSLIILGSKGNPKVVAPISDAGTPIGHYGLEALPSSLNDYFPEVTTNIPAMSTYKGGVVPVKNSPVDNDGKPEKTAIFVKMMNATVPTHKRIADEHQVYNCGNSADSGDLVANSEKKFVKCCDIFSPSETMTFDHVVCNDGNAKQTWAEANQTCTDAGRRLCYASDFSSGDLCANEGNALGACFDKDFWTFEVPAYVELVPKVQVQTDALWRPLATTVFNYGIEGGSVTMNRKNDGNSSTEINFNASFMICFFLLLGGGQLLGSLWKYTGNELEDRMYEQQVLTGVRGVIIWSANYLWDYLLLIFIGWMYCAIASGEKHTIEDIVIAWTSSCVGYLWMVYTLGLTMTRSTLNTVLTTLGFICFIAIFVLFIVDFEYLQKIIGIEGTRDPDAESMYDRGYFKKDSIWLLKIPFMLIPPCQFFVSYWLELLKTAGVHVSSSDYHNFYGECFGFNLIWFVAFLLVNVNWKSDPKPEQIKVDEDQIGPNPGEKTVTAQKCSKVFRDGAGNPLIAVNNVSFDAYQGKCMGVLGKNGAGKSTMMNMLSTWYAPTQGRTTVRGLNTVSNKSSIRDFIGICNQQNIYWNAWTAKEHLKFFGLLRGVPYGEIDETIEVFARELKFSEHLNTHMNSLSGGNKRKVALCASIIGKSNVLYLDEPSAGVDPFARDEMKNVLIQLKDEKTILFTSHTMEEAEIMCDEIVIMKDGEMITSGGVTELIQKSSEGYFVMIDVSRIAEGSGYDVKTVETYVQENVNGAQSQRSLKDGALTYMVPFKDMKLSALFEFQLAFTEKFPKCNCMIESASLEQLFKEVVNTDDHYTQPPSGAYPIDIEMQDQGTGAVTRADSGTNDKKKIVPVNQDGFTVQV